MRRLDDEWIAPVLDAEGRWRHCDGLSTAAEVRIPMTPELDAALREGEQRIREADERRASRIAEYTSDELRAELARRGER